VRGESRTRKLRKLTPTYQCSIKTEVAKKYNWQKGAGEGGGVTIYMKGYSRRDYTRKAIDAWVKLLRERRMKPMRFRN
jgi:hypothetical protein